MQKLKLHWQILIAMVLGIGIGVIFQDIFNGNPEGTIYTLITSLGVIFVRLLKMVIVPLIFTSIVTGVSGIGGGKSLGRIGTKTFLYYLHQPLCHHYWVDTYQFDSAWQWSKPGSAGII